MQCARMNGLYFNTGFHAKLVSGEISLFVCFFVFHVLARQHEKRICGGAVHSHLTINLSCCLMCRHQCLLHRAENCRHYCLLVLKTQIQYAGESGLCG